MTRRHLGKSSAGTEVPPKECGKVADTRQGRGERAGGRERPGDLGVRSQSGPTSPTHPRPGRGRPALRLLLTCGGGGGDCSGRGRDASCGCAHGRAGAGPMARLGSVPPGRSEGGGCRDTREPRALPGELSCATPGSEPHEVSCAALAQFRPPPLATERSA